MGNRIVVDIEALERVTAQLRKAVSELDAARNVLFTAYPTRAAGAELRLNSAEISLQSVGVTVRVADVSQAVTSYGRALSQVSSCARNLSSRVRRVSENFAGVETGLMADFQGQSVGEAAPSGSGSQDETKSLWDFILDVIIINPIIIPPCPDRDGLVLDNIAKVFDEAGAYGADQGAPKDDTADYDEFRSIIQENTGRKLNDEELKTYLEKLNSEGCGYAAMTNTILQHYEGREEEFEQTFGFPMYKDGDLNYNTLLVDIYSSTDNHNKGWFGIDKVSKYEDYRVGEGFWGYDSMLDNTNNSGVTLSSSEYRIQKYLSDHGVESTVTNYTNGEITVENFYEYAAQGDVQLSFNGDLKMVDANGTVWQRDDVGHRMTITGVEDGKFVLSSWGEKYYLDPSEVNGTMRFQVVNIQ
jgi:hypothetical protein